jgi:hypothetical protein
LNRLVVPTHLPPQLRLLFSHPSEITFLRRCHQINHFCALCAFCAFLWLRRRDSALDE